MSGKRLWLCLGTDEARVMLDVLRSQTHGAPASLDASDGATARELVAILRMGMEKLSELDRPSLSVVPDPSHG